MKQAERIEDSNRASLSLREMTALMEKIKVVFPKRKAFFLKSKAQMKLGNNEAAMRYISIAARLNLKYKGTSWRNKQVIYGFQEIDVILAMGDASLAHIKLEELRSIAKINHVLIDWFDVYDSLILFRLNDISGAMQAAERFRIFNMYIDGIYYSYTNWIDLLRSKM